MWSCFDRLAERGLLWAEGWEAAHRTVADVRCPVVVGEAEHRTLDGCLSAAVEGRGGCVYVTGEAGIGTSRLVREFSADRP